MPKFAALIAAAGLSSRMGFPKALMKIEGKAAALRLTQTFFAAAIEQVAIALPDLFLEGQDVACELQSLDVMLFKNRFADCGYAGSIMSGISLFSAGSQGIFITPIDVVFNVGLLRAMRQLAQSYAQKPLIIVPHCPLEPGHPIYLSHHFFTALNHCHDGLHLLIKRHRDAVVKVAYFDEKSLLNINDQSTLISLHPSSTHEIGK